MATLQYVVRGPDGREYGPVDLMTLQEWVRQGRITHDTKIRNQGNGMLLMASNMPELDGFFVGTHLRQTAAMASGMIYAAPADPGAERWEDYKFTFTMSVLGLVSSFAIGWFGVIFCIIGMIRAVQAAREGKPMSGLAFAISLFCMIAAIVIPFLVGFWILNVLTHAFGGPKR